MLWLIALNACLVAVIVLRDRAIHRARRQFVKTVEEAQAQALATLAQAVATTRRMQALVEASGGEYREAVGRVRAEAARVLDELRRVHP